MTPEPQQDHDFEDRIQAETDSAAGSSSRGGYKPVDTVSSVLNSVDAIVDHLGPCHLHVLRC